MRWAAASRACRVIAVTSVAHSLAGEPSHSSGTRLADHADVVLDLCTPPGDALIAIEGIDTPVGPGSSLAAVAIANGIEVRGRPELLVERGAMTPVITSRALVGRERSQELFDAAYAEHARRLTAVLSRD